MKSFSLLVRGSLLVAFSAAIALLASGCQASADDLCNKMCSCSTTCTDESIQQCVTYYEQYQKVATEKGCGNEFQAALSCGASGQCEGGAYTTDCDKESAAFSACEQKAGSGG